MNNKYSLYAFGIMQNITALTKGEYDPFNTPEFFNYLVSFFEDENSHPDEKITALIFACLSNYVMDSFENRNMRMEKFSISDLSSLFFSTQSTYIHQEIAHLLYAYNDIVTFAVSIFQKEIA